MPITISGRAMPDIVAFYLARRAKSFTRRRQFLLRRLASTRRPDAALSTCCDDFWSRHYIRYESRLFLDAELRQHASSRDAVRAAFNRPGEPFSDASLQKAAAASRPRPSIFDTIAACRALPVSSECRRTCLLADFAAQYLLLQKLSLAHFLHFIR